MTTIVKAIQTCFACPSQWDAWTDDGRYLYLRYRHGGGTATIYDDINDDFYKGDRIAEFDYGHPLDGVISLDKFCELAGIDVELR